MVRQEGPIMHITIPAAAGSGLPPAFFDWLIANGVDVPQVNGSAPVHIYDQTIAGITVFGSEFQVAITVPLDDYLAGWLLEHFGEHDPDESVPLDDMSALYKQLGEAREAARQAKERADEARDQILARLRQMGATVGTIDGRPAVERKIVESSRVDTTKLRREQPDIAAIYTTTSTSERLEIL